MAEVLILPGLDGTGTLHGELAAELGKLGVGCRSIAYPTSDNLDYQQLARFVSAELPKDRPYVLLGESFSGPIAILVATSQPANLKGLILSTTFAKAPLSFLGWASRLTRIAPTRLPAPLVGWFLLGRWASRALVDQVQAAIAAVQPSVLRARAAVAMQVNVENLLPEISTPTLVLRANNDRLLALASSRPLAGSIPNAAQVNLDGPHLLLQAQPSASAQAIAMFVRSLGA